MWRLKEMKHWIVKVFWFGVLSGSIMFSAEMETIRRKNRLNRIQRDYEVLAMYLP